jgi:ATP-dependent DNA helicase RecG
VEGGALSLRENRHIKQLQPVTLPISTLKGVGPKRAVYFARKGIHTILDLFFFTPLRYEDRTSVRLVGACPEGVPSLVRGRVVSGGEERFFPSRTRVFKIQLKDDSGELELLWFNYRKPHLARFTAAGTELFAYGAVKMNRGRLQMVHPDLWTPEGRGDSLGFCPVYSSFPGVSPALLRAIVRKALDEYLGTIADPVPGKILEGIGLPPLEQALRGVHFPPGDSVLSELNQQRTPSHRRLLFDRFFLVMLTIAFRRKARRAQEGSTWVCPSQIEDDFSLFFPFTLTSEQVSAFRDILQDLGSGKPMNRLLLGDVGCGKTAVAALTAFVAVMNGTQAAIMAPTQVLANQHFDYFSSLPREMGLRPILMTSALKKADREEACRKILNGSCNLVVGTQSLIQDEVRFANLGLVVIDEQQRFGVRERALMDRKGRNPHQLVMTATPIPRTLAMTVYGDMDISMIREYPAGHKSVLTRLVEETEKRKVFDFLRRRLALGQRAFVICPVIEDSEDADLKSAVETAERLRKILPPPFRIGLMHGRLAAHEKESVMGDFRSGKIHVLVGTTVVEVGVHVPDATVMIIEHPERFGLAQLHQIRGRVGRGAERGVCVLMASAGLSDRALCRLRIMTENCDGFEIAQKDLEQRGHGELIGMRQAGLGELDLSEMMSEPELLLLAKEKADLLLESDPELLDPRHHGLKNFVESILTRPIDI